MTNTPPEPGALRMWHVAQIPCPAFQVDVSTAEEGLRLCDILADYDAHQFEHRIKPDYANVNGVERYESDGEGGFDWFDLDPDEIEEATR
jgi:hypothetical protein